MRQSSPKIRLGIILWLAGFTGVLSLLLIDIELLVPLLPPSARADMPPITPAIKLLSLVQPAIILTLAVLAGLFLAAKVGLSSPVAEAAASGGDLTSAFKPQIIPGLIGGLVGGLAIVLSAALTKPFLAPEVIQRIGDFGGVLPLPTRLLYGGITEEVLLRWGLMTLLVWIAWRLFQRGKGQVKPALFVAAILISSFVFGVGHLPVAFMLFAEVTFAMTMFVIIANSVFGLIAGYLYWKKGLESAVVAHAVTHIILFTVSYFGGYF